jgi:hypothetical protein
MAMTIEKEWRPRENDSELMIAVMQEGERCALCLGIRVNTLSTKAQRLQEEGHFQSRSLSAVLSSLARQCDAFQRLFDGGIEPEADFVTLFVDKAWWCRRRGDASAICKCLQGLLERSGPTDFLALTVRGEWNNWLMRQPEHREKLLDCIGHRNRLSDEPSSSKSFAVMHKQDDSRL